MAFTAAESGWLLSGGCDLRASAGPVDWRDVNSSYVATLPLTADGVEPETARFIYRIPKKRATEPALIITLRNVSVYRYREFGFQAVEGSDRLVINFREFNKGTPIS